MKPYEYDGRGHEPPYPAPEIPPDLSQELADAMEEIDRLRALNANLLAACEAIFAEYHRSVTGAPEHWHRVPGRWDKDGSPCQHCANWNVLRAAVAKAKEAKP